MAALIAAKPVVAPSISAEGRPVAIISSVMFTFPTSAAWTKGCHRVGDRSQCELDSIEMSILDCSCQRGFPGLVNNRDVETSGFNQDLDQS
jgi:hypothetical protein